MRGMRTHRRTSVTVCMVAALAFALALASSCGSNNPTGPTLPTTTSIRGSVHQGPVAGARVDIRHVRPDGTIGEVISGSYTTDVNGDWAGTIPAALPGPFLIASTGGTYIDEVTGTPVTIGAGTPMYGFLLGTSSQVTPLTHTTFLATQALVARGTWLTSAMTLANSRALTAFGFNPSTTIPSAAPTAGLDQKKYAGLLGGLATLVNDIVASGAFTRTSRIDLVLALASDMTNGKLDGLDARGNGILVPTD